MGYIVKKQERSYTYTMKTIVTHTSPDWDAITSVWIMKRFMPGWEEAQVRFVPAGGRIAPFKGENPIESINSEEVVHVDTGLGPLDHHQTSSRSVCGASKTWDFVRSHLLNMEQDKQNAITRLISVIIQIDHFQEIFWPDPTSDRYDFSLIGLLEGVKMLKPDNDQFYVDFSMECLDATLREFENKIWGEKEIKEKGREFQTRFGKALAIETINGGILKIAQKIGYILVVRKDPRKGNVQIKTRPEEENKKGVDLTLTYEQLRKMDPEATWFLHVSKKMLLNGTVKNPTMVPTKLTLEQITRVLEKV